jgi:SH3-like domain-containing protein
MPIERLHRLAQPASLATGILCVALCLPGVAAARGTAPVAVEVADAYLELHTGPGRGYPVTRVIPRGDQVEVLKRRTDWYLLRDDRGHEGWAKRKAMALTLLALSGEKPDDGFRTAEQRAAEMPATATTNAAPGETSAGTSAATPETPETHETPAASSASLAPAAPMARPGKVARNLFNDGSYPDAENHHWEAGAGGGRRAGSKVLRATLSYLLDENLSVDVTLSQVLDGPRNEDLVLFGLTHTFHPENRIAPFVTMGLGASRLHQAGTLPADTREMGYAAAGFRVLLQQRLMFRADYRSFTAFSGRGNPKETNEWNVGFVFLF